MTEKQNNNNQNLNEMKNVLELLFKKKENNEIPRKISVQTVKQFTEEERNKFNQWCKDLNVSAMYEDKKIKIG